MPRPLLVILVAILVGVAASIVTYHPGNTGRVLRPGEPRVPRKRLAVARPQLARGGWAPPAPTARTSEAS
jgi:hypothetical protein